jgi:sortase (surface protein transpeptidase)
MSQAIESPTTPETTAELPAVPAAVTAVAEPLPAAASHRRARSGSGIGRSIALIVGLVIGLALGFGVYLYGLSSLSEQRSQTTMYKTLRHELAQAVAPVSATKEGLPMAVLTIPDIGLKNVVVVEGTSSRDLTKGPGHLPDTVYPGQSGTSVIYGKVATFGAPFSRLMQLQVGDVISVTTGQGTARYRVSSFGDDQHPAPANSANRLVLATADSAYLPRHAVSVAADLISPVQPAGAVAPVVGASEHGLSGDASESVVPLLLWAQALLLLTVGGTIAAFRWSRWPAVLCAVPMLVPVVWNVFENLAGVLPNLY